MTELSALLSLMDTVLCTMHYNRVGGPKMRKGSSLDGTHNSVSWNGDVIPIPLLSQYFLFAIYHLAYIENGMCKYKYVAHRTLSDGHI